ncbi:reverse transcriptase [Senna tora]|uniref:Reverse transcriptase n=1 Tax=Senna tora TaxID=362788 RepID=A0A834TRL2_9FABA|nr:reverse transcriptase [Senna tora]
MPRQPRLSSQANRREVMQRNRNKKFRMELRQRLRFAKHFKTPIIIPLRGFFSEKPNGDTPESHQLAEPQHQNPIPLENMGEPHISTHNPNNLATSMGTPTVRKLDSSDQRTSSERANDEPSGKRTSNFAPSSYHSYQPCSDRSSDEQRAFQHQPTSQGIQSGHLHIARFIPGESPSRSPPLHNQLSPISGRLRHVLAIARHGISERYIEPELEESVGSVGQDDIEIDNNMTPINILTWNARGAASADFCLAIMDLKTCHLPRVVSYLRLKWEVFKLKTSSRALFMWDSAYVKMDIHGDSFQEIQATVELICGDFNEVLSLDEKWGGLPASSSRIRDFKHCVEYCGVTDLVNLEQELAKEFQDVLRIEEELWASKCRIEWLQLGDSNTSFFHSSVIERRRSNRILALQDQSGNWLYNPLEIKDHITDYFFNCFTASPVDNIDVNLPLPSISSSDKISLSTMPNALDIKNALFSLKPYKAPGVDGFQAAFFQKVDSRSISAIKNTLNSFLSCFGLSINNSKSSIWFSNNTPPSMRNTTTRDLNFSIVDKPGKYLGSFLGFKGKTTLINSVISPIITFHSNYAILPSKTCKLNSDGACSGNLGPFAISGIIRDHMGNWVKGFSGYVGHGLPFEDLVKLKCPTPSEKETSVLIFLLSVPF